MLTHVHYGETLCCWRCGIGWFSLVVGKRNKRERGEGEEDWTLGVGPRVADPVGPLAAVHAIPLSDRGA